MDRLSDIQKQQILDLMAKTGNASIAVSNARTTIPTLVTECRKDKSFAKDYHNAKETYADFLEAIMDKRIQEGNDKASAILLMFRLKALRPELYRESTTVKHEGTLKIISGVPRPSSPLITTEIPDNTKLLNSP